MAFSKKKVYSKKTYRKMKPKKVNFLPHDKVKTEKKFFDIALSAAIGLTTGFVGLINPIGQGITASARIGNRIDLKSVQYKCQLLSNQTGTPLDTSVRVMLVYDKEPAGVIPPLTGGSATTSILDNTIGNLGTLLPLNLNNKDRFIILSDKLFRMQHNGTSASPILLQYTIQKWKALDTYTQYNSGSSGIGSIVCGSLYLCLISDISTGLSHEPQMLASCRARYTDQ